MAADTMKKIAIIPARAGSKGLPNKNVLMVAGKPLLAYSIETALEAGIFDQIILTTESQEYIDLLSHYPITFRLRPEHLAADTSSSYDVIEDILSWEQTKEHDYFVLLQPTSPLRSVAHTLEICKRFEEQSDKYDFSTSVCSAHKPTALTRPIDVDGSLKHFELDYSRYTRQGCIPEYSPNGVYFIAKPQPYLEQKHFYGPRCIAFFMDKKDSIDIDDRDDFEYFYFLTQQKRREELLAIEAKHQIQLRRAEMLIEADITLLGDSLFGQCTTLPQWDNMYSPVRGGVQNICISAIYTKDYLSDVLGKSPRIAPRVLVAFGRDDLRKHRCSAQELLEYIILIIERVLELRPDAQIYVLDVIKSLFRVDCDNTEVEKYNSLLVTSTHQCLQGRVLSIAHHFDDNYGKLAAQYTEDGFNLNALGYEKLQEVLSEIL